MSDITIDQIKQAYYFLKNHFYYDSIDLFTKYQLAVYEDKYARKSAQLFFEQLRSDVLERLVLHNFQVSFRLLPKEMHFTPSAYPHTGGFFHNISEKENYPVKSVNFFIQTDIPTRILDILWVLKEGSKADKTFARHIYASRLLYSVREHTGAEAPRRVPLFKKYISQYTSWRDGAFDKARKLLKRNQNCLVALLDIYRCFYSIDIPWSEFENEFGTSAYTCALRKLHQQYFEQIRPFLTPGPAGVLPVGLLSSGVLANWYLQRIDQSIIRAVQPAFYGRYVDDILVVKPIEEIPADSLSLEHCFRTCFPDSVFTKKHGPGRPVYTFTQYPGLQIQPKKLFIHYFSCQHSTAGLRALEEEVRLHNSLYRFLPARINTLRPDAFFRELEYYHTQYHFPNLLHIKNAVSHLSLYLSGQIFLHQFAKKHRTRAETLRHLRQFFKGKNFLDFSRFWIKLFYLLVMINRPAELELLYADIRQVIGKLRFPHALTEQHLQQDLRDLLLLSLLLPTSLNPGICPLRALKKQAEILQNSNLFENRCVLAPLMNFMKPVPSGFLNPPSKRGILDARKWLLSPRFIHLDEYILFHARKHIQQKTDIPYATLLHRFERLEHVNYQDNITISNHTLHLQDTICTNSRIQNYLVKDFSQRLRVALAHIKTRTTPAPTTVFNWNTQRTLHQLIGQAQRDKAHLVLLPAGIIPAAFLPNMVTYARQTQMGFIFTLQTALQSTYWAVLLPFIYQRHKTVLPLIYPLNQIIPPVYWHHLPLLIGNSPYPAPNPSVPWLHITSNVSQAVPLCKSTHQLHGYHIQMISSAQQTIQIKRLEDNKVIFHQQGFDEPVLLIKTLSFNNPTA